MSDSLTDAELAQLRADFTDKQNLIIEKERERTAQEDELTELYAEAGDLATRINAEMERRKDLPGTVLPLRPPGASGFRPQPGGKPEDGE